MRLVIVKLLGGVGLNIGHGLGNENGLGPLRGRLGDGFPRRSAVKPFFVLALIGKDLMAERTWPGVRMHGSLARSAPGWTRERRRSYGHRRRLKGRARADLPPEGRQKAQERQSWFLGGGVPGEPICPCTGLLAALRAYLRPHSEAVAQRHPAMHAIVAIAGARAPRHPAVADTGVQPKPGTGLPGHPKRAAQPQGQARWARPAAVHCAGSDRRGLQKR